MRKLDDRRLEELQQLYPLDNCRQIATFVLENSSPSRSRQALRRGHPQPLDGAAHAAYLTIIQVDSGTLMTAAVTEAERLWEKYGDRE